MSTSVEQLPMSSPWYTYPWVWFLIAVPLSAVAFGIVMIVSANYAPDDLVVDNYYKEGKGINRRIRQDVLAAELGVIASLDAMTEEGLVFSINSGSDELQLSAYHVTSREQDLSVPLQKLGDIYTGQSQALVTALSAPGVWYLEIRDEKQGWRVRRRVTSPIESGATLDFAANELAANE